MSAHTAVFGHDVKFDENGHPIEKGVGAIKHAVEVVKERIVHIVDPQLEAAYNSATKAADDAIAQLKAANGHIALLAAQVDDLTAHVEALTKANNEGAAELAAANAKIVALTPPPEA